MVESSLHSSAIQDWIIGQLQLQGLMETQNIMPSPPHGVTSKVVAGQDVSLTQGCDPLMERKLGYDSLEAFLKKK